MDRLKKEILKKPEPGGKVSPRLKTYCQFSRHFGGKNRALIGEKRAFSGFWNFCLTFAFLSGLIFSQGALANLYETIGLTPSATEKDIAKAYKKKINFYHPDKHINGAKGLSPSFAEKIFVFLRQKQTLKEIEAVDDPELKPYIELKRAFYILRDPTLKRKYDEQPNSPGHEENMKRQGQEETAGNPGQNHASGASAGQRTSYGRGNHASGASAGRRTGRQSVNESGLLHEAILSAERSSLHWSLKPHEQEAQIVDTVQAVLEGNININKRDHNGKTALYLAVERGYSQIVRMLLKAGANPNIPDNIERLPAHVVFDAPFEKSIDNRYHDLISKEKLIKQTLSLLAQFKADFSKRDNNGQTVIEIAMENELYGVAGMLLEQGAHYLTDTDREILSVMAVRKQKAELIRLIRKTTAAPTEKSSTARHNSTAKHSYPTAEENQTLKDAKDKDMIYTALAGGIVTVGIGASFVISEGQLAVAVLGGFFSGVPAAWLIKHGQKIVEKAENRCQGAFSGNKT